MTLVHAQFREELAHAQLNGTTSVWVDVILVNMSERATFDKAEKVDKRCRV